MLLQYERSAREPQVLSTVHLPNLVACLATALTALCRHRLGPVGDHLLFYMLLTVTCAKPSSFQRRKIEMFKKLLVSMMVLVIGLVPVFNVSASFSPIQPYAAVAAPAGTEWPMSGANPQRTSWAAVEVSGGLSPEWYRIIEPYIPAKAQLIAANGLLYISTAQGLYALDAATGSQRWVYSTELPLGNSPTIANGIAYVGGFDRRVHAIDANTGAKLWAVEVAQAGFDTNPLVISNTIMLGNRDGNFYALNTDGSLKWKYTTAGPIHFSAAYQNGVVYFASDDSYAYALNAANGSLVWKSVRACRMPDSVRGGQS